MLFNSIEFLLFLPLVFVIYWNVKNIIARNCILLFASYLFYGWISHYVVLLLLFTSLSTYLSGILIERYSEKAKLLLLVNILSNMLVLAYFKYFDFFYDNVVDVLSLFSIKSDYSSLKILLPLGISFYTFEAVGYTYDVYKKKISPEHNLLLFLTSMSFFPKLLSGPICKVSELSKSFSLEMSFNYRLAVDGLRQILWGAFSKFVVADLCASIVNNVWSNLEFSNSVNIIIAAVLYSFQIYFDFAGYSNMAIGIAKLYGIELPKNFNYPYFSVNIAEFWRKWHISLTSWFREYIYIPLGGSRKGKLKTIRNTFVIFVVCGFWHGASWTFIIWGFIHAILFVPLLLSGANKKSNTVSKSGFIPSFKEVTGMTLTFIIVTFGWIIFRAPNLSGFIGFIKSIYTNTSLPVNYIDRTISTMFIVASAFLFEWFQKDKEHPLQITFIKYPILRHSFYIMLIACVIYFSGSVESFIYFNF